MPNIRGKIWTTTTPANVGDAQWWEDHLIADEDMNVLRSAVQSVNDVVADEDGNVEISTVPPGGLKNQVLKKNSNADGDASWGDGGHTIQDANSIDLPHQNVLQFYGADVTNDNVNKKTIIDCHGQQGDPGKSAYEYAVEGGYTGSEAQFTDDLGQFRTYAETAEDAADDAEAAVDEIRSILATPTFEVDFTTGELIYDQELVYNFEINETNGNLEWEVVA